MSSPGYPPEFRKKVLDRVASGEPLYKVAMDEGISQSTITLWKQAARAQSTVRDTYNVPSRLPFHKIPSYKPIPSAGKRIAVIPDMQVKPGIDLSYCSYIGRYMADKKPDIIVNGGDFADMSSLSTHDPVGCKRMEGARYEDDILAVQQGMKLMMEPIREAMASGWNPRLVMLLGNHEDRIPRAIENTPKLDGKIGLCDLKYEEWGWKVYPFLEPIVIEGIVFSHYFCSGVMGRPITTARAILNKKHMSAFAFHQQGRDIAFGTRADGHQMIAIIAGSCYEHEEHYLNPQTNNHWRGLYILNDVIDGAFEENAVSLKYLKRKYG